MPFEKFTQAGQSFKPKMSIWGNGGQIGFNQGAMKKFKLDIYKYAILFFDRENKRIGIKFTNDEKEEGINKFNAKRGVIPGKAFMDYYGVDYSKTKPYDVVFDEENELYIVNLE